jgi:hypothetical protein
MTRESQKSRHIGGKPDAGDEADNRKRQPKNNVAPGQEKGGSVKPKNPDVGDVRKDR